MNIMWYWLTALLVLTILFPAALSAFSHLHRPETGIVSGRLRTCPGTPNCISSEDESGPSYVEPVIFHTLPEKVWENTEKVILEMGGRMAVKQADYLHATFRSPFFRFVDDLEIRMDRDRRTIHFRSASRIGYSDLGVNRKRVADFRRKIAPHIL